jgi:hypothetical protein
MIKAGAASGTKIEPSPGTAKPLLCSNTCSILGMAVERTSHPNPDGILAAQL